MYHKVQQNAGRVDSHSFLIVKTYRHFTTNSSVVPSYTWHTYGLPKDFTCKGPCSDTFRSPHEAWSSHRQKCGTGKDVYKISSDFYIISMCLSNRTVSEGCGRGYYNCPSEPGGDEHKVRTCNKSIWEKPPELLTHIHPNRVIGSLESV
ncbi:hypothetical protein JT359_08570 [Candidatus Poribacteria bacterium]|nr:hypothetical protein [Candidatus Poribacteria bacterium]